MKNTAMDVSFNGQDFLSISDINISAFNFNAITTMDDVNGSTNQNQTLLDLPPLFSDIPSIAGLSVLFFVIVFFGIVGNCLVILVILLDMKMRRSVTNMLIVNLAVADLITMVMGVPEIYMVIKDEGWMLGPVACQANRFILVVSLYSSVLSLVTLCFERFIAIVFPLRVSKWCTRRSTLMSIFGTWIIALFCGLPVAIFNRLAPPNAAIQFCQIILPGYNKYKYFLIYKHLESFLFYFLPMIFQIVLYSMIAKQLYTSNKRLRNRFQLRQYCSKLTPNTPTAHRALSDGNDAIRARRGVVKMLVCSIFLYFISYSPVQAHLIYNTFNSSKMFSSRQFFIFVMVITHINSAANPFLYGIFSQNFRRNFKKCFMFGPCRNGLQKTLKKNSRPRTSSVSSARFISTRSTFSSQVYRL